MSRIVVITGASSGIGLELKNLFEGCGDKVLTISRSEGDSNHYSADVSHEIKMRQVFNDIKEKYGRIDILINNAGVGMSGITELLPIEDIEKLINVNLYGVLHCVRNALPLMSEGGKIINMSSAMAFFPVPFRSIYGAVKSAILNFSFSLKMEVKPLGIDVCAICPGDIKTNFTNNRLKHFETNERYGDRIKTATEKNDGRENKRMPVDKCGQKIFKLIQKKKLRPFYIVGGKYKFLHFLTRITPKSWLLNITAGLMNGKMEEKKRKTPVQKVEVQKPVSQSANPVRSDMQVAEQKPTAEKVEEKKVVVENKPTEEKKTIERPASSGGLFGKKTENKDDKKKDFSSILSRLGDKNKK